MRRRKAQGLDVATQAVETPKQCFAVAEPIHLVKKKGGPLTEEKVVKAGHIVGATDETGEKAVEVAHPIRDIHCTILSLLGLDDAKLTYFHGGRFKQLTQVGAQVIPELMA